MSLEPTGTVCFSGHLLSSQGLCPTCLGESPPEQSCEDRGQGGHEPPPQGAPPGLIPALQGLEEAVFLTLLSGPTPFLSYRQPGLLRCLE